MRRIYSYIKYLKKLNDKGNIRDKTCKMFQKSV